MVLKQNHIKGRRKGSDPGGAYRNGIWPDFPPQPPVPLSPLVPPATIFPFNIHFQFEIEYVSIIFLVFGFTFFNK